MNILKIIGSLIFTVEQSLKRIAVRISGRLHSAESIPIAGQQNLNTASARRSGVRGMQRKP